jgi:hypothetical protein
MAGEELISFDPAGGPNCGGCQTTKFTASSTGRVWIESGHWEDSPDGNPDNQMWYAVRQVVRIAPERFAAFRDQLRPYRPVGRLMLVGPPACAIIENHSDGVTVRWQGGGEDGQLIFDFSSDPETRRLTRNAVRTAPAPLGIRNLHVLMD